MQQWQIVQQVLNWFVPPLIAVMVAGIWGSIKMWAAIQQLSKQFSDAESKLKTHQDEDTKRFDKTDASIETIKDRLGRQDIVMATIASDTRYIKENLDHIMVRTNHQ